MVPAIEDLAVARERQPVRPADDFDAGRRSLNLVGYEGVSMIAVSGLDMAARSARLRQGRRKVPGHSPLSRR